MKIELDWKHAWYLLTISLPVALVDQLSKIWASGIKGKPPVAVFDTWFHFIYSENRGALFGMGNQLPEFYRKLIFLGFSSLLTLFILVLILYKSQEKLPVIAYSLLLGGAVGNLIDRFIRGC